MDWLESFARNSLIAFVQEVFGLAKNSTDLRLRWSSTFGTSIEGKVEDLHAIRSALEETARRMHGRVHFFAAIKRSPAPYTEFLNGIRIEFKAGLFQASVTPKRWLLLAGDDRALRCAANYFQFPTPSTPGEPSMWVLERTCPVTRAGSNGRCNTLHCIDSSILPKRRLLGSVGPVETYLAQRSY
jgi:hypothetical protein